MTAAAPAGAVVEHAGQRRPIRIGNCSGFYGDRFSAMHEMLTGGELDVLTGDYLAELTMLILGRDRLRNPELGYAKTFVRQLEGSLGEAVDRGVRIVANAGGLNPAGLADAVGALATRLGLDVQVGYVAGDDLLGRAAELGVPEAITANAYLGGFGIARCLESGADVVVTGRVTDASLVVGPAAWWHGWAPGEHDRIAGAMAAGHVIECSAQATGGNYSFTAELGPLENMIRPGFPLAEVAEDGSSVVTKHPSTGGAVTVGTVTAQLLYEVTGARYAGPDATLRLDSVHLHQVGPDRVALCGVRGEAPPPDLKVSTTALGGFRNEVTYLLTGLDAEAKAVLTEAQLRDRLQPAPQRVDFRLQRTDHPDAADQPAATAALTVVAWDADPEAVGRRFSDAAVELVLSGYAGATPTAPPGRATPYGVYRPVYVEATSVEHIAVLPGGARETIPPAEVTAPLGDGAVTDGDLADGRMPEAVVEVGWSGETMSAETMSAPLGLVFGARSGDKGGSANIGLWARDDASYRWLREQLTVDRARELLPECAELAVERYELPNLRAINLVIEGILGLGVAHGHRFDPQAKGLAEWLRSRHVELPVELVERAQGELKREARS